MRLFCFVLLTSLLFIPLSCDKEYENPVPSVHVDLTLQVGTAMFPELHHPGGWLYYSGGYRGVIIYRLSYEEFKAYDMACPFHPSDPKALVRVIDSPLAQDTLCGSTFILIDGSVITGPSRHPLREYQTYFDGMTLRVIN